MPEWAKGEMIAGASYPDMDWPYFSMDHSYNPYTKKGMRLVFQFPDLMSLMEKEVKQLFHELENTVERADIPKILKRLGRMYHFMSDLAVPAHVHNIPHMFIDLPRIGKCDFEEYLGLDQQLIALNNIEIGDISSIEVNSFDDFWLHVKNVSKFTFLASSFTYEELQDIARERLISDTLNKKTLIKDLSKKGVSIVPVEGLHNEDRYYVRHLTSHQCYEISQKATFYSLKSLSSCFLFLVSETMERLEKYKLV